MKTGLQEVPGFACRHLNDEETINKYRLGRENTCILGPKVGYPQPRHKLGSQPKGGEIPRGPKSGPPSPWAHYIQW